MFFFLIGRLAQKKVIPAIVPAAAGLLAANVAPTAGYAPCIATLAAVDDDGPS